MNQYEYDRLIAQWNQEAQNGDMYAMKKLGDAYFVGVSEKEQNIAAALPYWKIAVDNGEHSAAYNVGVAFASGGGCTKSEYDAFHYFLIAADNGDIKGQFKTGLCYEQGFGCTQDKAKAKQYYEKAALRGHGGAQWRLGYLKYLFEPDGLHWICCAHLSGVREATDFLDTLSGSSIHEGLIQKQIRQIRKNGIDPENSSNGCYVATCVYGSYDCPQVWTLRRFRDNTLAETWYGRLFIRTYYALSPTLVKWFGHFSWFKNLWKGTLDRMVSSLNAEGVENTPYQDKVW